MTSVPYRTEVGYDFPIFEIVVTAEEQRRLHGHCDIADGVYGEFADPTFIARDPNSRAEVVSEASAAAGDTQTTSEVRQFPPSASDSM